MRRDLKYSCLCLDDVFPSKQPLPPIGETSERPATGRDTVRVGISACLNRHHPPFLTWLGATPLLCPQSLVLKMSLVHIKCLYIFGWIAYIFIFNHIKMPCFKSVLLLKILANRYRYAFVRKSQIPVGKFQSVLQVVNLLSSCQVTCLDFLSPRLLIAGTTNGVIILWDVEEQKIIQRLGSSSG